MQQVKCGFCEHPNEPGRTTCSNCGGPLPEQTVPPQQPASGPFQQPVSGQFQTPYSPYGQPGYGQPPSPYAGANPQAYGPPPQNNLAFAILSIFCCWPLSIVAIVKANQVNDLWSQGRQAEAREASSQAATWATIALIVGLIVNVFVFIAIVASN